MHNWADFIAMGGYGLYVWGSVGVVVLSLVIEQIGLRLRFKSQLRALEDKYEL